MKKLFYTVMIVSMLLASFAFTAAPKAAASTSQGFSIVRMEPDAQQALEAKTGKDFKYPFPNIANNGRKFNPGGDVVGQLETAPVQNILVLFATTSDTPPGGPAKRIDLSLFDDLLFGDTYFPPEYADFPGAPNDRTLKNYYWDVSYGTVTISTLDMPSSVNWVSTGKPYSAYVHNDNGFGWYADGNVQTFVEDAVLAADEAGVDFSKYAVNGEVPNLFVVYAGTGAEWSGAYDLFWSHSWSLDSDSPLTNGVMVDGVKVNNYVMMPEVGGDLTGFAGPASGPFPPTVGVFAHEYGHMLGLPDQYDYGYESEGTGLYSLMAGGSWNRYPNKPMFSGNSPAFLDSWSLYRLGFIDPVVVTGTTLAELPPLELEPVAYKMVVPNSGGKEYFLFENRQQIKWDQGFGRRGAGVHGMAIYHIDDTVMTRNYWRPNEAENWKEFRSEGWKKAANGEMHYGISIIQADDLWDFEHGVYTQGYEGDLYPGVLGKTSFSSFTAPNSSTYYFWGGSDPKFGFSGVTVENITETDASISAKFSFVPFKATSKR